MAARRLSRPLWRLRSISSSLPNPGRNDQHRVALMATAAGTAGAPKTAQSGSQEKPGGAERSTHDVPRGHHRSDLSDTSCHIGLMRMRDLTLRQDIRLLAGGASTTIGDALKGHKVLLVGLPGGKVCAEKHVPEYLHRASELVPAVFDKIVCIMPEACGDLKPIVAEAAKSEVAVVEDQSGAFARMMGLERTGGGAKSQRFAAIVEDGILLGLRVEKAPGEVKATTVDNMLALWSQITKNR
ncbi:unnamed protein product [Ostreobium quekettii]|uniref:glutaredoxin-dependent peroxiredoxin n=1 Tax=Ostreobium quekettii TaxID=121088 RepID=A0A8S1IPS3_9CHLO|nr:unnamed protein product [Ostreobium quekettii]|eukprot:evm.model.scf_65.12 EVM.evm.TU.scf_65.12   scf_65:95477-99173(-)